MIRRVGWRATLLGAALLAGVTPAGAQPLGTFTWQLQPYCNRVTVVVTHTAGVFTLDGYDDQCGAAKAPVSGVAVVDTDGSIAIGLSIVPPAGTIGVLVPVHLRAALPPGGLSGTWTDTYDIGTFVLNGSAAGNRRPAGENTPLFASGVHARGRFGGGAFFALSYNGTVANPSATLQGDTLGRWGAGGHTGTSFDWPSGQIEMVATENWTPTAQGTQMRFLTTPNGSDSPVRRLVLDANGSVGIGTISPLDPLHVNGDIRTQTGCVRNGSGTQIAGLCASDRRLKRDITEAAPVLDRVGRLRPVYFYWRADQFPARGFGAERAYGLIADDVEQVLPELVSTDAEGFKRVDYSALPLLAVQAIGELRAENGRLGAANAELAARLARIEADLQRLTAPR